MDYLEDRAWVLAQKITDRRISDLGIMITAISTYMGSEDAYEHYVHKQLKASHPTREMTITDYMILNEIAAGSLNTVN